MPGRPGAYDLDAVIAWRKANDLEPKDESDDQRARLLRIEADTRQLKLDRLRGELIEVEPVRRLFSRHIHEAKAHLERLPDQVLAAAPGRLTAAQRRELRDAAAKIVRAACQSLADAMLADELRDPEALAQEQPVAPGRQSAPAVKKSRKRENAKTRKAIG